ncbi:MAG: hypothetical protein L0H70_06940, partial [Xanthomonadales bacterium]|nr:hypothetical protein [Xanthomonadales bacterium]
MIDRVATHGLQVASSLHRFVEREVLPGLDIEADAFWAGLAAILRDLSPRNRALLSERDRLQAALDAWYAQHPGPVADAAAYHAFLRQIGYLEDRPAQVKVSTANVDAEMALQAGPQLVVPVTNARYALNAANARWGSLYDALYGTDAIADDGGAERGAGYNPIRGARVVAFVRQFLDDTIALQRGSHADAVAYTVDAGDLRVRLRDGGSVGLADGAALRGWRGAASAPNALLLRQHGLHFEIQFDAAHAIGKHDAAHIKDVMLEAALTTIVEFEDSV